MLQLLAIFGALLVGYAFRRLPLSERHLNYGLTIIVVLILFVMGYELGSRSEHLLSELAGIGRLVLIFTLTLFILNFSSIPKTRKISDLTKEERLRLIKVIKGIEFNVTGLLGFDKAMITSGGISLKEVDSKTMKSKIINNLYFAGEVLDIDGPSGGYNLQVCWTTGYVAGINSTKDD